MKYRAFFILIGTLASSTLQPSRALAELKSCQAYRNELAAVQVATATFDEIFNSHPASEGNCWREIANLDLPDLKIAVSKTMKERLKVCPEELPGAPNLKSAECVREFLYSESFRYDLIERTKRPFCHEYDRQRNFEPRKVTSDKLHQLENDCRSEENKARDPSSTSVGTKRDSRSSR